MPDLKDVLSRDDCRQMLSALDEALDALLLADEDGVGHALSMIENQIVEEVIERKVKQLEREGEGCYALELLGMDLLELCSEMDRIVSAIRRMMDKIDYMKKRIGEVCYS